MVERKIRRDLSHLQLLPDHRKARVEFERLSGPLERCMGVQSILLQGSFLDVFQLTSLPKVMQGSSWVHERYERHEAFRWVVFCPQPRFCHWRLVDRLL